MISLILKPSERNLVDGVPEYVTFETSSPATVYYTLDGSQPDSSSLIASGNVYLPTSGRTVEIRAVAISASDSSDDLQKIYRPNSFKLNGPRNIGAEGIAVMRAGDLSKNSLSVDKSGEPAQESSTEFVELDIKASRSSRLGVLHDKYLSSVSFINFPRLTTTVEAPMVSSVNNNYNFDPNAKVIIIDGTTDEKFEEQVVKIVNRPYNNMDPVSKFYDEQAGNSEQVVTGNFVKSYYNSKTGVYTSFYWESRESRWIKSIQKVEKKGINVSPSASKGLFVYRWIQERSGSQIF